ncbi:hypothetical protein FOL47_005599 [Perkinsus chesapeaki]|uniref:Uncharacterized protein n=1 Tax=Perkinsus chesapeaki TaxID=330153 RepID=A0A7J6LXY4_PERCH|nr:hypothetical protein FOL47_005599 [Perkinsus chesapeaki]
MGYSETLESSQSLILYTERAFRKFVFLVRLGSANSWEGRQALDLLRKILGNILLRRTKAERHQDVQLLDLVTETRFIRLAPDERAFYDELFEEYQEKVQQLAAEGQLEAKVSDILVLLLRLRQAANHRHLITYSESLEKNANRQCLICYDEIPVRPPVQGEAMARGTCGDVFHNQCIRQYTGEEASGLIECPSCLKRVEVHFGTVTIPRQLAEPPVEPGSSLEAFLGSPKLVRKNTIISRIPSDKVVSSSKVNEVLDVVQTMVKVDPTNKFLIFSQFTSLLEITEQEIRRRNMGLSGTIHGGLNVATRNRLVYHFKSDPNSIILLISLRAAGEGINLQAANRAFIVDPWWNPAAELQAIQRAHRLGQTREVKAIKFIVQDTIEERILLLQEKKQLVSDTTIGGDESATYRLQQLSLQDLKFLFKL